MHVSFFILFVAVTTIISEATCTISIQPGKADELGKRTCAQVRCSGGQVCRMEPAPNAVCTDYSSYKNFCYPLRPVCKPRRQVLRILCGSVRCPQGTVCRMRSCLSVRCVPQPICVRKGPRPRPVRKGGILSTTKPTESVKTIQATTSAPIATAPA
ncbi:unnamed protein product [Allacma fusca]|uniref:Follistatin-like domain-containing protein n=1 Tax=Allacma fusca TaxID=39272 RepID=A0A8J2P2P2_9HEXA|nr:unnamed protein product [Allacma fusca]